MFLAQARDATQNAIVLSRLGGGDRGRIIKSIFHIPDPLTPCPRPSGLPYGSPLYLRKTKQVRTAILCIVFVFCFSGRDCSHWASGRQDSTHWASSLRPSSQLPWIFLPAHKFLISKYYCSTSLNKFTRICAPARKPPGEAAPQSQHYAMLHWKLFGP